MFNFNKFLPIIMLPCFLSACGGGSESGASSNNNVPTNLTTSEFMLGNEKVLYAYDIEQNDTEWTHVKTELSIQKGILYEKTDVPAFSYYYITQKGGIYEPETKDTYNKNQGLKDSFVSAITDTQWITTPYNKAGRSDLKLTQNFKVIDLNSTKVVDQIVPAASVLNDIWSTNQLEKSNSDSFITKLGENQTKFSAGAQCIQRQSVKFSDTFFEFDPNDGSRVADVTTLEQWAVKEKEAGNTLRATPIIENWNGTRVASLMLNGVNQTGTIKSSGNNQYRFAAEYKGNVYRIDAVAHGWNLEDMLTELDTVLKEDNWWYSVLKNVFGETVANNFVDQTVRLTRNKCDYYNETAAKDIDTVIRQAQ